VAVTMGCGDACPNVRAKQREEWNTPDPKALPPEEFRKVRDQIEQKVRELLARLSDPKTGTGSFSEDRKPASPLRN